MSQWSSQTRQLVQAACDEDLGAAGDITAALLGDAEGEVTGRVVARQAGVICGLAIAPDICAAFSRRLGRPLAFAPAGSAAGTCADGAAVTAGTCVATVRGPQGAVLAAERTLLNFLGRLSGVATLTRRFVDAARQADPQVQILDTRKTLPGWRELDKYAVRTGGGHNHRFGLYDAILIKDNHLAGVPTASLAGVLGEMLGGMHGRPSFVEVEVDSLQQLAEVCRVPAVDIVLLDNFTPDQMRAAVELRNTRGRAGGPALEASGGVRLEQIAAIAATGVERISVGALTHSAPALDIALDV